jgi:uncharacterized protein
MARAPVPGRTKTRLEPLLGPQGCARLQAALVRRTAAVAGQAAPGAVFLACAGPQALLRPLAGPGTHLLGQSPGDLGDRMATAVAQVHSARPGPVVVVGTDCPALGPEHVRAASAALIAGHDAVFGPAHDGGYYLVALTRPVPAVFALPPELWGGPDVLARSLAAARSAGLRTTVIEAEHDLDTPADAEILAADPRVPGEIVALLATGLGAGRP